jgi:serine/threonine protein kinase
MTCANCGAPIAADARFCGRCGSAVEGGSTLEAAGVLPRFGTIQLADGSLLAGYRVESLIGRGGMGNVYRATHERLGRAVALKVLAPDLADDPVFRERFIRESQLAASLEHPNVVPIYDAGEADGVLYIAMRYIPDGDLGKLLAAHGRLGGEQTLEITSQIAGALDAAHRKGLVHRDIKPANILIADRHHALLSDFGLARHTSSAGLTRTGAFLGTVDYCAPEQIEGIRVDGRADIYALGCVIYHCLAGTPPFARETDVAVIHAHLHDSVPSIASARLELPPAIDHVIATATAKNPDDRYQTGTALAAELRAALGGVTTRAGATATRPAARAPARSHTLPHPGPGATTAPISPRGAWRSRRALVIGGIAVALIAAGAAAAVVATRGQVKSSPPPPASIMPRLRSDLTTIAARQTTLNTRLRSLTSSSTSLQPINEAGAALQHDALIAKGHALRLRPHSQAERVTLNAFSRAVADDAVYAAAVSALPGRTSALTGHEANQVVADAQAAETSLTILQGTAPSFPVVPIDHTDDTVLVTLVPPPTSTTTTAATTTIPTPTTTGVQPLTTFSGSIFSIDYPSAWVVDTSEQQMPGYVDTTIRDPSDFQHTYLRADYTSNTQGSLYHAANQQRQNQPPGYVEIAFASTTLDGQPAIKWEFEGLYQKPGDSHPVLVHKVDIFMIDQQHTGWAILTQAPAATYDRWLPTFDSMLNSFTVTH